MQPARMVASILVRALAGRYLERERIEDAESSIESLEDPLAKGIRWPVYPEIGVHCGIEEPFVRRTSAMKGDLLTEVLGAGAS